MKVLIAEDELVSRKRLESMLAKWGYEVVVASNGIEAMEVLEEEKSPRLCILDWMMEGMDGLEICKRVRKRPDAEYKYIILLTAKTEKTDIVEALTSGADDFVTKPYDARELQARVKAGRRVLDLQSELITARETLRMQATRDVLTGLPNRLHFTERLNYLTSNDAGVDSLAVLFIDLDRFKFINDSLGHDCGDQVITEVGARLKKCLADADTISRVGGDEFTVIYTRDVCQEKTEQVCRSILEEFAGPIKLATRELFVTASIGAAIYPNDGKNSETLVKNADTAMYKAKDKGKNTYQLYSDAFNIDALRRMDLENRLRKAFENQEFTLYYQPRVNIYTGEVMAAEALIRWEDSEAGIINPSEFIPLAEETGLIVPISKWVIGEACRQCRQWMEDGYEKITIAVNVSARDFQQEGLLEKIQQSLAEYNLSPDILDLEITESTIMNAPDMAIEILKKVKEMGISVALDDFGTGYSSLSYLKRFPVDSIKIDRAFVRDITTCKDDAAIAGAVISMAHSLGMRVVAEGVETMDQQRFMASLSCDEMQGFIVSEPLPANDFQKFLEPYSDEDEGLEFLIA